MRKEMMNMDCSERKMTGREWLLEQIGTSYQDYMDDLIRLGERLSNGSLYGSVE